jgi:hypothetical protein
LPIKFKIEALKELEDYNSPVQNSKSSGHIKARGIIDICIFEDYFLEV